MAVPLAPVKQRDAYFCMHGVSHQRRCEQLILQLRDTFGVHTLRKVSLFDVSGYPRGRRLSMRSLSMRSLDRGLLQSWQAIRLRRQHAERETYSPALFMRL